MTGFIEILENKLKIIFGLLFIISAFLPIGGYQFEGANPSITGPIIFAFFPLGWLSILIGSILIFYDKFKILKQIKVRNLLILGGAALVFIILIQDDVYAIRPLLSVLHNTNNLSIDIDSSELTNLFLIATLVLPYISILTGILLYLKNTKTGPYSK